MDIGYIIIDYQHSFSYIFLFFWLFCFFIIFYLWLVIVHSFIKLYLFLLIIFDIVDIFSFDNRWASPVLFLSLLLMTYLWNGLPFQTIFCIFNFHVKFCVGTLFWKGIQDLAFIFFSFSDVFLPIHKRYSVSTLRFLYLFTHTFLYPSINLVDKSSIYIILGIQFCYLPT